MHVEASNCYLEITSSFRIRMTIKQYLAEIGRRGGAKSKRKLTKAQAKAMVAARELKRKKSNG